MEQETKKTDTQMINEIGDFIHEAFCVDGITTFDKIVEERRNMEILVGNRYKIEDKKRGEFFVTISKII